MKSHKNNIITRILFLPSHNVKSINLHRKLYFFNCHIKLILMSY